MSDLNCHDPHSLPLVGGGLFGTTCTSADGYEVRVGPSLPTNPTGVRQLAVQENYLDCRGASAASPLATCTPTQPGESR